MAIPAGLMKVDDTPANERCYAVDACLALALHTLRITPNFRMVSVLTQVDEQGIYLNAGLSGGNIVYKDKSMVMVPTGSHISSTSCTVYLGQ